MQTKKITKIHIFPSSKTSPFIKGGRGDFGVSRLGVRLTKFIFLLALTCCLCSCGFRLYGQNHLPSQLNPLYLQSQNPNGSLEIALKNSLQGAGIKLVNNIIAAPVTLNIINTSFTHSDSNVVSNAQATIYNFSYTVTFDLLNSRGKPIIAPQAVGSTRTITLNPNEVIDSSPEVDTAKDEMTRDLIFKIFTVLNAKNSRTALAKIK